jgi:hypothetical protein
MAFIAAFLLALYFFIEVSPGEENFEDILAEQNITVSNIEAIEIINGWTDELKYMTETKELKA